MAISSDFLLLSRDGLFSYVAKQIQFFFPDGCDVRDELNIGFDDALDRLNWCIERVTFWRGTGFHPLQSEKNAVFLCYLATGLHKAGATPGICEKVFYLNKSLNGFHCFYTAELPDVFIVGHSVGTVLVSMKYPSFLGLSQCATVGRDQSGYPNLSDRLILFPGSSIIGRCNVGPRTIIAPNTTVVNQDVPGDCVVTQTDGKLVFRKPRRDLFAEFYVT